MTCDNCKTKPAEVFLTQIVDGKMQKVNLCKDCSKEKGVDDPTGFALADLLLGMGENTQIAPSHADFITSTGLKEGTNKCPSCGFTQSDFKKTGRLGCSECYTTFVDNLTALLKAMHKGILHVGKVPKRMHSRHLIDREMQSIREDLEKAVADENYENAATLRDKLKTLEEQLGSPLE